MYESLIELALKILSCNQKELAQKLGVSSTQITKWKQGEYISSEMRDKLTKMLGIGDLDPDFILKAGSVEQAQKWAKLIEFLAAEANENEETGYDCYQLTEMTELLYESTLRILMETGVTIPQKFPEELDIDYDYQNYSDDQPGPLEIVLEHPIALFIYDIFKSLTNVSGFYSAYISELMYHDDIELYDTPAENIEPCLIELAAAKLEPDYGFAPNFKNFKRRVLEDYKEWLNIVKLKAMQHGVPLRAELMDLIYQGSDRIGATAEAESLGLNEAQLHPDIYMNELLVGMRTIHQILPFIMKKMGIYEEFKLDMNKFHLDSQ